MARTAGVNYKKFYGSCFNIRGSAAENEHARSVVQVIMFRKQADEFVGIRTRRE